MKARGNTKIILTKIYEVQNLIGGASADFYNDRNRNSMHDGQEQLTKAQELLREIIDMYDPIIK